VLPVQGILSTLLLFVSIIGPMSVPALADTGRPNREQGPTQVQLELFLLDLDAIDSASQSFDANVYFEAKWKDPRLANGAQGRTVTRSLDHIWFAPRCKEKARSWQKEYCVHISGLWMRHRVASGPDGIRASPPHQVFGLAMGPRSEQVLRDAGATFYAIT
jgi:hypothetical protein